jgi:6,7-dimethyl-8-ribityllumazine synthase
LEQGAVEALIECGVKKENINVNYVPGTFELIYGAKKMCNPIENYAAVIVLGCVIQGETPHFTYVCEGVTYGIAKLNAHPNYPPVIFGVLTTGNLQQAEERAGGIHGNKGVEAAITAIKMANI